MSKQGWASKMDKGWPLPEDHLPEGRVCVQFEIPDDQTFAAAVIGHIMEFGKWWNWEKGGGADRRATETAQLFRTAIHETLCVEKYREMGCKCDDTPKQYRYNEDGQLEVSTDGGVTWNVSTVNDYRSNAPLSPPLPVTASETDDKCRAANNIVSHLESKAEELIAALNAGGSLTEVVGVLIGILIFVGIIGTGGAATPLILALGGALLLAGGTSLDASLSDGVWDTVSCIIYCHIDRDGSVSDLQLSQILSKVQEQLYEPGQTFVKGTIETLGKNGLTNMARTPGDRDFDCSSCSECNDEVYWDFRISKHGVVAIPFLDDPNPQAVPARPPGTWASGQGFGTIWAMDYYQSYDGDFLEVQLPNDPALIGVTSLHFYSTHQGMTFMPPTDFVPSSSGNGAGGTRGTYDQNLNYATPVDLRGAKIQTSYLTGDGNHNYFQGFAFTHET